MNDIKRIERSIFIYAFYDAISCDLLFFIAIKTLLFSDIKGLDSSQINMLSLVGIASALFIQLFSRQIVHKIGKRVSVQMGNLMYLAAALLFTFGENFTDIMIGYILYNNAGNFRSMAGIILSDNLKALNRFDDFTYYQNKANVLYAIITLIISLVSGYLFNLGYLVPMAMCIFCCIASFAMSFFLYDNAPETEQVVQEKTPLSKDAMQCIILYGFVFAILSVGQNNGALMIKQQLAKLTDSKQLALINANIITISRLVRVGFSAFYPKLYKKMGNRVLMLLTLMLCGSFAIILLGSPDSLRYGGVVLIAIGYYVYLAIRDGYSNTMRKTTLSLCQSNQFTNAYISLSQSERIVETVLSLMASLILKYYDFPLLMLILLVLSLTSLPLTKKVSLYNSKKNNA